MLFFKFHQIRTINKEFHCWGVKATPKGAGDPILNIQKPSYSTVVPTQTEIFNILARLESA